MSELKDILGDDSKGRLPEEKLLAYLEGRLSADEQREVERLLTADGMESDAVEGLQNISTHESKLAVDQLNHALRKELMIKKRKRSKAIKDNPWALLAIALTLLFAILAYFVIRMMIKK